ncbi:phenylacetate-CoA oxygenase subunit PaaJ [Sphingobacteriales bacterium UPWRP_1]|nr:phenylacetate-CoA oxygenase subunit PaaJ [Sphingobacteriales bacterium TSM_CSM]PSJ74242.1 phenylacetate-CoA oxygenase subunit PaaJ [Sphingobacteriales bacterium UPWRP_1]
METVKKPDAATQQLWEALQAVKDPEIPVISVVDLGIITAIHWHPQTKAAEVIMTPTFTACPATKVMQEQIRNCIAALPFVEQVTVTIDFSEPWNSNRISERGKQQLKEFGLAPPAKHSGEVEIDTIAQANCPYCGSSNTSLNLIFGPTLCRSMHFCYDCRQAFEAFKPVGSKS